MNYKLCLPAMHHKNSCCTQSGMTPQHVYQQAMEGDTGTVICLFLWQCCLPLLLLHSHTLRLPMLLIHTHARNRRPCITITIPHRRWPRSCLPRARLLLRPCGRHMSAPAARSTSSAMHACSSRWRLQEVEEVAGVEGLLLLL